MKNNSFYLLILLLVIISACKKTEKKMIATWKLTSIDGDNIDNNPYNETYLKIYDNNTFARKDWVHVHQTQYSVKEISGTWEKVGDEISFSLYDSVSVTVMVSGIDSSYKEPCEDFYTLTELKKKQLTLSHNTSTTGCFLDSYGTTFVFEKF